MPKAVAYVPYTRPIVTRAEAKAAEAKRYFTGKPCPKGHIAERYTTKGTCIACLRLEWEALYESNHTGLRERRVVAAKAYREANLEVSREKARLHARRVYESKKPYMEAWRAANAEKLREWRRARDATLSEELRENRRVHVRNRRARKKGNGGKHTAAQIRDLLVRQRYKCPFCPANLRRGYHADHIMPLALGGSNDISNIQLLCPTCNDSKGYSHPIAWAQKKGRLL
jgi:5-methylcytosine-specific restriction endonuclease McrA